MIGPANPSVFITDETRPSSISQALRKISCSEVDRNLCRKLDVRPIRTTFELESVYRITHDSYLERHYCEPQPNGRLVHFPEYDCIPETTVLIAVLDGEIVGTTSFTLDGPLGLHVDHDFKSTCDLIRSENRTLAASWRLATKSTFRNQNEVVMALISATTRILLDSGTQTCLFTFNPRHERIYQRLLNMKTVARGDRARGLLNAPSVLMRCDHEEVPERFRAGLQPGSIFRAPILSLQFHGRA